MTIWIFELTGRAGRQGDLALRMGGTCAGAAVAAPRLRRMHEVPERRAALLSTRYNHGILRNGSKQATD